MSMLSEPHALSDLQIESFRRDGHVRVDGLLPPDELAPIARVIADEAELVRARVAPLEERSTYDKAFLQLFNLWRRRPVIAEYVLAPRFADVAARLLGVERVRLYHDQALFKEPGGGHTPWHQDALYWPLDGRRCITMWMALGPLTPDMGLMTFADGSQRSGALSTRHISDESEVDFERVLRAQAYATTDVGPMEPGDATFHGGWTVHRANANASTSMRPAMTVIWFADGEVVQEPTNPAQEHDRRQWLPGCAVGAPAASDLNVLIDTPTP